ncbi:MAG: cell division protein FtsB [Gammaproteobacteria bacterium]|nr:MAG: cell division protein FtsB [Gammaproteobacteria bacterium]
MQKIIFIILLFLLLTLQYRFWFGKANYNQLQDLQERIETLNQQIETMNKQNREYGAKVQLLKKRLDAVEEYARYELHMKKKNEEFYPLDKNLAK